ncbi:hypothetical protein KGP17_15335 [Serratia sp. JSRIV001]|nr:MULTISPECIES: hypothetical protein [unclassified Serratia (in: enterobacteria)]UAN48612.1 hypothetical protein KGP17_15335 [Serratia sp. JSRIV001]UAN55368.1 hypothetical protein KGP21_16845 [Serratia sp. JSRIV004]
MIIPDHLIRGLSNSTRPIVLYRNEYGDFVYGFVLRPDEFVTSLAQMTEARKMAGLPTVDDVDNPL